ncbi:MAG TPA: SpoIIE family protein phosphatase [Spirochaetota bacterium]|nr:SpoIIE family protein phosphatase [Spirochaetota bacterium]HNT09412.1 SpoIIE family protein phosphatase [Spirochaetota bacterium]
MNQARSRSGFNLSRRLYGPRNLGFVLAALPLAALLYQHDAVAACWGALALTCFAWPHVAYWVARRADNSNRAELRNLQIDSVLGGAWCAAIGFNPLVGPVMFSMLMMDAIAVGGSRLLARCLAAYAAAALAGGLVTGFRVDAGISLMTALACLPLMILFPSINGTIAYLRTRQVVRLKNELERQKDALFDVQFRLEEANRDLRDTNDTLRQAQRIAAHDMRLAANVQMSVLPGAEPSVEGWEIAFYFRPMSGVSGDFYDFYVRDGRLEGVALFDVSGHGISSALITMLAKSLLYRLFVSGLAGPLGSVLTAFNHELFGDIGQSQYYLTGVLLRIDGDRVEYVNAAHQEIVRRTARGVEPVRPETDEHPGGFFLGISSAPQEYDAVAFVVEAGELVLLYTDCLSEARNAEGELYGRERISASLMSASDTSAQAALSGLCEDFYSFVNERGTLNDDLTIIVLRKTG